VARLASLPPLLSASRHDRLASSQAQKARLAADYAQEMSPFEVVVLAVDFVLVLPILLLVSILFFTHVSFIASNVTTIESLEIDRAKRDRKRGRIKAVSVSFSTFPFLSFPFPNTESNSSSILIRLGSITMCVQFLETILFCGSGLRRCMGLACFSRLVREVSLLLIFLSLPLQ